MLQSFNVFNNLKKVEEDGAWNPLPQDIIIQFLPNSQVDHIKKNSREKKKEHTKRPEGKPERGKTYKERPKNRNSGEEEKEPRNKKEKKKEKNYSFWKKEKKWAPPSPSLPQSG